MEQQPNYYNRLTPFLEQMKKQPKQSSSDCAARILYLTKAIRIYGHVNLHEGYEISPSKTFPCGIDMLIAASKERIMDVLTDCMNLMGEEVQPTFRQYSDTDNTAREFWKPSIDVPILESAFFEFEDVILDDGMSDIGLITLDGGIGLRMLGDKLISISGMRRDLKAFSTIMQNYKIPQIKHLETIRDHRVDLTYSPELYQRFQQLTEYLGMLKDDEELDEDDFSAGSPS